MSEFRKNPVSGSWIIVAPERAARPTDFPVERRYSAGGFCPFCEGHEDKTPPEIASCRAEGSAPNKPGWRVRVVPNRFPALRTDGPLEKSGAGLCAKMSGYGIHEVIIENPRHVLSLNEVGEEVIREVLLICQQRIVNVRNDGRLKYAMLFKNVGSAAGATVEHSHSQLIGMPVVPTAVQNELRHARRFSEASGGCIFCHMLDQELAQGERIVHVGRHFVALTPFASRFPFETWILPTRHGGHFEDQPADTLADLAESLRTILDRLDVALDTPAYNYLIHTAPFRSDPVLDYHWHVEIIPCITKIAGFEWGTGCYINPVLPESAAAFLREAAKPHRSTR